MCTDETGADTDSDAAEVRLEDLQGQVESSKVGNGTKSARRSHKSTSSNTKTNTKTNTKIKAKQPTKQSRLALGDSTRTDEDLATDDGGVDNSGNRGERKTAKRAHKHQRKKCKKPHAIAAAGLPCACCL